MKTISTLLSSFFITSSIFATNINSSSILTVKSASQAGIVVVVDDKRFDPGVNSMMVKGLDAREYELTIYQERTNSSAACLNKSYDILFDGTVEMKPDTQLEMAFDDCGKMNMNETSINANYIPQNNFENTGFGNDGNSSNAINDLNFARVLWAIGKESSETNKLESVTQVIRTSYFTLSQVKQLMQLFCSEDNKLEVARLAYNKTVDQSNYYSYK
ncbi:MAG TPA: DUF4476 domain-containing protein [Chitinophagaceae bacterium]